VRKMIFAAALIAALIPMAVAQDAQHFAFPTVAEYGQNHNAQAQRGSKFSVNRGCKSDTPGVVYYSGDFNSTNPNANGFTNEMDLAVAQSEIVNPVKLPKECDIAGIFENTLSSSAVIDPAATPWDVRTGVTAGNGGTVLCSGTAKASYKPTGRSGFGLTEYTVQVKLADNEKKECKETNKVIFFSVVPVCLSSQCSTSNRYFESDEEDEPGIHHIGPKNIIDDSFINSSSFGFVWAQTGPALCGIGCDMFSTGIIGQLSEQ
jgi:hypothetical protein